MVDSTFEDGLDSGMAGAEPGESVDGVVGGVFGLSAIGSTVISCGTTLFSSPGDSVAGVAN